MLLLPQWAYFPKVFDALSCSLTDMLDWVKVLCPTPQNRSFRRRFPKKSLGLVMEKTKPNTTKACIQQSKEMYYNTKQTQQVLGRRWAGRQFDQNSHGPKIGGCAPYGGKLDPHVAQCGLGPGLPLYQVASWSIQSFGHNRHGPKNWGLWSPFLGEGAGSTSNTILLGPRPTSLPTDILIHPAIWPQQIWTENWGMCPWGRGSWVPMWPGPRPTYMPSFILIHRTVWPQYTNTTDRTDRQWSGGIGMGHTILQMVAQKTKTRFSRLLPHLAWKRRQPILISTLHKCVTYLLT